ncbi:serine protease [Pseudocolwellia sp. AS88]|uniref:S1C family serine protease n=1 Tax=Pseudocolwellia sp. AS88 TaxID=3063958 RepID=UPI0026E94A4F|nr:serine protease [Pseudocolwellia sp. AS88]MDO7084098.1 serine protease [Pseudocolwellia sp. AS88]
MNNFYKYLCLISLFFTLSVSAELADTLEKVKPSIVGVGIYTPTGRPKNILSGSGFVIGNGRYVITNHHVVPKELDAKLLQEMAVFVGSGKTAKVRKASLIASSERYDLAVLEIKGAKLPPLTLASSAYIREGTSIAFTGFPIGSVLGLYPVTHRGIIAAITPTITPVSDVRQLSIKMLKKLRDPFMVYQLDATAYPGNSGSAMYDAETGKVIGIINKVFIQESKEAVISKPSGITYAIPVKYLHELLEEKNIKI